MDQALPPSLAAELAELKRRVADLERTPRLTNANVTGRIRLIDEDGTLVGWLGEAPNGTQVVAFGPDLNASGIPVGVWWDETNGLVAPFEHVPWIRTNESVPVTATSFTVCHQTTVELAQTKTVRIVCSVVVPAGTTGELRFRVSGSSSTSAYPLSNGFAGTVRVDWDSPMGIGTGPFQLYQEVRTVSGAGPIAVFSPYALTFGGFYATATPSGTWTVL